MGTRDYINQYKETWPIWRWEVRWERWLNSHYGDNEIRKREKIVYSLLALYPEKKRAREFQVTDLEDWKIIRARQVKPITLAGEVYVLHSFFKWLINEGCDCPSNPVCLEAKVRSVPATPDLSLAQLRHLWNACLQPVDKQMLLTVLQCASTREAASQLGRSQAWMSARYAHLRALAQFPPIKLNVLHKAFVRLASRLGERAVLALLTEGNTLTEVPARSDSHDAVRPVEASLVAAPA